MYKASRGTSDILPEEQPYWRYVEEKASALCQVYGYNRIDTPIFEDANLFVRSIGEDADIVSKEMYIFTDRSGKSLTLKPEGTAPVCRAFLEHGLYNLPQPVKLYYITPLFRYERPQAGRYRQHSQFGFEAIGDGDPALDVEVIEMAWQFYLALGLEELSIQLNSIGCKACRPEYLESLKQHYSNYITSFCPDCQRRLLKNPLRLLDCKKEGCQNLALMAPKSTDYLCPGCRIHFEKVKEYLGFLKLPFELNHTLVRGLDYYTRTVFEIQPYEGGAQSTIGGGGRYDNLIEELGGKPTPAVGFATGIERVILNLKKQGISVPHLPPVGVFVAYLGEEAKIEAIKLSSELRKAGIKVTSGLSNKSLKAQLRQANSMDVHYSVIIGEEEVKTNTVILRNMTGGSQKPVPLAEIKEVLLKEVESIQKKQER